MRGSCEAPVDSLEIDRRDGPIRLPPAAIEVTEAPSVALKHPLGVRHAPAIGFAEHPVGEPRHADVDPSLGGSPHDGRRTGRLGVVLGGHLPDLRKIQDGKLSVMQSSEVIARKGGVRRAIKALGPIDLAVSGDVTPPPTMMEVDATESGRSFRPPAILSVLRAGADPQIGASVIQRIAIGVIDHLIAHRPGDDAVHVADSPLVHTLAESAPGVGIGRLAAPEPAPLAQPFEAIVIDNRDAAIGEDDLAGHGSALPIQKLKGCDRNSDAQATKADQTKGDEGGHLARHFHGQPDVICQQGNTSGVYRNKGAGLTVGTS